MKDGFRGESSLKRLKSSHGYYLFPVMFLIITFGEEIAFAIVELVQL